MIKLSMNTHMQLEIKLLARVILRLSILLFVMCLSAACVTTLEKAVEAGDIEAARRAINNGENVNGNYWTSIQIPIHRAIENGDLQMIKLLHENGTKIYPPFVALAAQVSAVSTYRYLLNNGGKITACTLDTSYPDYADSVVSNIMPALGSAIARHNVSSVQALLDLGAPLESHCEVPVGPDYTFSAILLAAYFGDPNTMQSILRAGGNPNRLSKRGYTPLSLAAEQGHYEAARILLANGAFHTYTSQVKQPIEIALDSGHDNIANLLVHAGATRPHRTSTSEVLKSIGDAILDGVVVVGTIALIVEGSKYYGYNAAYTQDLLSDGSPTTVKSAPSYESSLLGDSGGCHSNLDCGALGICLKRPGHMGGVCVDDDSNSRLSDTGMSDTVISGFPRPIENDTTARSCPGGYHWDFIYSACVN